MSTQRHHRIDRGTAERLLDGDRGAHRDDTRLLAAVLIAAAAPARPYELAGEEATLAAFRVGLRPGVAQPRRGTAGGSVTKLFSVKAVALAVATATAAGGVALATTGGLPTSLGGKPATSTRGSQPGVRPATGPAGADRAAPQATTPAGVVPPPQPTPSGPRGSAAAPDPALVGLCRKYEAHGGADKGKSLDSTAFTTLITKAGGREKVDAFCRHLLADPSAGKPKGNSTGQNGHAGPTGKPSRRPSADEATAGGTPQAP